MPDSNTPFSSDSGPDRTAVREADSTDFPERLYDAAEHEAMIARLGAIRARMAAACARAGRPVEDVVLLPVSKTFGPEAVRAAMSMGLTRFGENKTQEIVRKASCIHDPGADWVMIGHLQTNKAKEAARLVAEVQSLDRLALAQALDRRLQHEGRAIADLRLEEPTSEPPAPIRRSYAVY